MAHPSKAGSGNGAPGSRRRQRLDRDSSGSNRAGNQSNLDRNPVFQSATRPGALRRWRARHDLSSFAASAVSGRCRERRHTRLAKRCVTFGGSVLCSTFPIDDAVPDGEKGGYDAKRFS